MNKPLVYASRRLTLQSGVETKLLDYSIVTKANWQAWVFSNDIANKSTELEFQLLSTFGCQGSLQMTIGGGAFGGGLITGTGACEVLATGQGNNDISIWFVDEQRTISLPPDTDSFQLGVAFSTQNIGYPPFGREEVNIKTTQPFELLFKDDVNNIVYQEFIDPTIGGGNSFMEKINHPPNTTLEVISSVANQRFIITHSQS